MFNRAFSGVSLPAVLAGAATAFVIGCSDSTKLPAGPSASTSTSHTAVASSEATAPGVRGQGGQGQFQGQGGQGGQGGHMQRVIDLFDACDPQTFNAALGPGTCVRNGGVTFANFLELLTRHHTVGAWHMTPPQARIETGDLLIAVNRGGETHTFTEVEEFGGGIVADLNQRAGLTTVAPECNQLAPADFIPAGGQSSETEDEEGLEKYQCCIHPWMRAVVQIDHAH